MLKLSGPLLLAVLAVPVLAQTGAPPAIPGAPVASRVAAATYKVDPAHTQVNWRLNHMGFSQFDGSFADSKGTLTLDPARLDATRLSIIIPITRVTTTSPALNKHLLSKDFFDAAKFPTATFVSTQVRSSGQSARITGDLTLHGVTKPVVLDARFVGAGDNPMNKRATVGFEATTQISRSAYGITYGTPVIGDTVDLTINAAFERE